MTDIPPALERGTIGAAGFVGPHDDETGSRNPRISRIREAYRDHRFQCRVRENACDDMAFPAAAPWCPDVLQDVIDVTDFVRASAHRPRHGASPFRQHKGRVS